ncbi:hypothetical protein [Demequina sp. NBRC 110056]|uniref:RraA family protein n=1 Tax=Demequina sp. NBRC 110056 TaxID=1570345 RepID=UPI00352AD4CB
MNFTAAGVPALDAEVRALLEKAPVAALSQRLRAHGLNAVTIDGVAALKPGTSFVGVARTLRYIPFREDLFESHGGGYNAQKRLFDSVADGEVIVIEARGVTDAGTLGDVLAARARALGATGIVTDGAVRDADAVAGLGLPVFSAGAHPAVLGRRHVPWESDVTVACGGASVQPGDVIVGDGDGVIVIPPALAAVVAREALELEEKDGWVLDRVDEGERIEDVFPMNAEWKARYDARSDASSGGASAVAGAGPGADSGPGSSPTGGAAS